MPEFSSVRLRYLPLVPEMVSVAPVAITVLPESSIVPPDQVNWPVAVKSPLPVSVPPVCSRMLSIERLAFTLRVALPLSRVMPAPVIVVSAFRLCVPLGNSRTAPASTCQAPLLVEFVVSSNVPVWTVTVPLLLLLNSVSMVRVPVPDELRTVPKLLKTSSAPAVPVKSSRSRSSRTSKVLPARLLITAMSRSLMVPAVQVVSEARSIARPSSVLVDPAALSPPWTLNPPVPVIVPPFHVIGPLTVTSPLPPSVPPVCSRVLSKELLAATVSVPPVIWNDSSTSKLFSAVVPAPES